MSTTDAGEQRMFAGTGAVGLEGLSRGARRAICVERDRENVGLIFRYIATRHSELPSPPWRPTRASGSQSLAAAVGAPTSRSGESSGH